MVLQYGPRSPKVLYHFLRSTGRLSLEAAERDGADGTGQGLRHAIQSITRLDAVGTPILNPQLKASRRSLLQGTQRSQ